MDGNRLPLVVAPVVVALGLFIAGFALMCVTLAIYAAYTAIKDREFAVAAVMFGVALMIAALTVGCFALWDVILSVDSTHT